MATTVVDSLVHSVDRIHPDDANNYGNAHGGGVVKLMDELAAISAMRVAKRTCVTAHIGSVDFDNPIPVGHVAEVTAYVYETGRSSLKVRVTVESRDPRENEAAPTTSAQFVMVAVDEEGSPVPVPDVAVESERGKRLIDEAQPST